MRPSGPVAVNCPLCIKAKHGIEWRPIVSFFIQQHNHSRVSFACLCCYGHNRMFQAHQCAMHLFQAYLMKMLSFSGISSFFLRLFFTDHILIGVISIKVKLSLHTQQTGKIPWHLSHANQVIISFILMAQYVVQRCINVFFRIRRLLVFVLWLFFIFFSCRAPQTRCCRWDPFRQRASAQ